MPPLKSNLKVAFVLAKHPRFALNFLQMRFFEKLNSVLPFITKKAHFLPKEIIIRVTEFCFLRCKMCGQGGEKGKFTMNDVKRQAIPEELLYKLIDEVANWPLKPIIKITGGEPLAMGDTLVDLVRYAKKKKLVVRINTNGVLLKRKKLAEEIVDTGIDVLLFSLDGAREAHNRIRGTNFAFDDEIQGIKNVIEYKERAKKKNPLVMITSTITVENQDQLTEIVKIAKELKGVEFVNFQFFNYTTKETTRESAEVVNKLYGIKETPWQYFSNEDLAEVDETLLYKQVQEVKKQKLPFAVTFMLGKPTKERIHSYYYDIYDPIKRGLCYKPFTAACVVPKGRLTFCIDYPFYFYGDLAKNSFREIWFSEKAQEFRMKLVEYYKKNKNNFPHCLRCNWKFN